MKAWFSRNCQTKKHFFQEIKYFLASRTVALLILLTLKVCEKRSQKG